ncbi:MAG: bifunctional proline dehydrogenase/L-glutamate gamma-semialdehyde dehydrogenase PutA, partial [Gammaproteobacteria bacterium]|nr:bifunctional proline dehydrogenase/L-glutamate gamma-semialdehyde dehydrogenase PutA [Gammaproteobacteria bacterium]
YGLSKAGGLALMCLAESLLRVPDSATADRLIADKVALADWAAHSGAADSHLVNASTWALLLTGKLVSVEAEFSQSPGQWFSRLTSRVSEPVIQAAVRSAMQILGREFVLGQTIDKAIQRSSKNSRYSYDMLGEAARTSSDAKRYFDAYANAIRALGEKNSDPTAFPSSISIKLSALHPRYEFAQRKRVLKELYEDVLTLCTAASLTGVEVTIDAEESDRLELSLDIFQMLVTEKSLADWNGLGIVVQAYGKRANKIIEWLAELASVTAKRIPVRLVKGAYWDSEIKQSQVMGYAGFPVYTRKASTDLSYLVCAKRILQNSKYLRGQFATHNAHTVAAIYSMAHSTSDIEFQRLHGMGDGLYAASKKMCQSFPPIRIYAPVGGHDVLLAYLVRRLLENGANSSFVNRFLDASLPPSEIVQDPVFLVRKQPIVSHPGILLPSALFGLNRNNSTGIDLHSEKQVVEMEASSEAKLKREKASSILFTQSASNTHKSVHCPFDTRKVVGEVALHTGNDVDEAFQHALFAQKSWGTLSVDERATILDRMADELEARREVFISILCQEAGKTIPDSISEIREAVDFCRYYATQARNLFGSPKILPGPTGELNELVLTGRGVFVCISPWNFPLAIFVGQVAAALVAGNAVIAKPSQETSIVAFMATQLMHVAGIPRGACQLVLGDGLVGAALVSHPQVAGVVFTGSTATAAKINLALATKGGPIVPLIAETGGQNVMIVDSTALLEQVTDDVIQSAFLSAGQRCSALRILYLQEDIADKTIEMIAGAMDELHVGNPTKVRTDVGPVISATAATRLNQHIQLLEAQGCLLHRSPLSHECAHGHFVAPVMFEINGIEDLPEEHFGPVMHIARFRQEDLAEVVAAVNSSGFGLTLGIHSRIDSRVRQIAQMARVGNVYINRNMVGAVVGCQPFGGQGLSGTGPKAGGPNYLYRFATEKVISTNTVATGGNAELLLLES